ncbi:MAG TPA: hypothetical protein VM010_04635 [Chitinophagaceae bacterium]|nr:hypothetical protein [Chitinophagaceae bacterium]
MKLFQKSIPLLFFISVVAAFTAGAQSYSTPVYFNTDSIATFRLTAINNTKQKFKKGALLSCYFFLSPDCPLCKNYAPAITALQEKYKSAAQFFLIVPGQSFTVAEIKKFSNGYLKKSVMYKDADLQVARYLHATVTPQAILMETKTGKQVYAGALDNWAVSLGRQRAKATENYLQDAIESYLHHADPAITYKEPVGCFINDF